MIYIEKHVRATLPAGLEPVVMPALSEALAALFPQGAAPERSGLYVATDNAGSSCALAFWAEAQRVGVGLASPELFPWCLANAPCGWLARQFQIRGPNATFVGRAGAWLSALQQASLHLQQERIDRAFVVGLHFSELGSGLCCASRLSRGPAGVSLRIGSADHDVWSRVFVEISEAWSADVEAVLAGSHQQQDPQLWTLG
jgi:hypothetical protein